MIDAIQLQHGVTSYLPTIVSTDNATAEQALVELGERAAARAAGDAARPLAFSLVATTEAETWALTDDGTGPVDHDLVMSTKSKDFHFPVNVDWAGGKRVRAYVDGKQMIEIATPPELKGNFPDTWSPEDFLVAAVASCYSVTMVAIAARRQIPIHDLAIDAVGHVGERADGRFGFQSIELDVTIETDGEQLDSARAAAEQAERGCLVSLALEIPVEVELNLRAVEPTLAVTG